MIILFPFLCFSQIQIGQDIDGQEIGEWSGKSISLSSDGNIVAIGAAGNDGNSEASGHVRVYENQSGIWIQIGQDIEGGVNQQLGYSVSISNDDNLLFIGTPYSYESVYRNLNALLSLEESLQINVDLFPNPAENQITIQLDNTLILEHIIIYNLLGKEVLKSKQRIINISNLTSGMYLVEVKTNKGKATKKLIIL